MYKCNCGGSGIIECKTFVIQYADVVIITEDNNLVRNNPVFDFTNAELAGYSCKECGKTIEDKNGYRINTEAQLIRFLKGV